MAQGRRQKNFRGKWGQRKKYRKITLLILSSRGKGTTKKKSKKTEK